MITVGIIGNGFVGNATSQFENKDVDVLIYDVTPEKCKPYGIHLKLLCEKSDIIFICLPTPMSSSGACHLGIIEDVMNSLIENGVEFNKTPVVIRSTVPVGTSNKYNCFFMPEFLTEANARLDFKNTECWIFGRQKPYLLLNKISCFSCQPEKTLKFWVGFLDLFQVFHTLILNGI